MPRGGCCGSDQEFVLEAGAGIDVEGTGTPSNPWVITAQIPDLTNSLRIRDGETVNLTITGSGNPDSPFVISAETSLSVKDLVDVQDPVGIPTDGEVLVWRGGAGGHWEFGTPPTAPAGAVNVSAGILGTGAAATPIKLAVAGTWGTGELAGLGTDSTVGLPVYIDSNGVVRAKPVAAGSGSVAWADITGKPTTFAPAAHKHVAADITDPQNLNAGKVGGHKVTSTISPNSTPANPATGDLWFFVRG